MNNTSIIFTFIFAVLIAIFIGEKRKIGAWWAFFFSLTFTPILGFIITLCSRKKSKYLFAPKYDKYKIGKLKLVISLLLVILGLLGAVGCLIQNSKGEEDFSGAISLSIGLIGYGIYLLVEKPVIEIKVKDGLSKPNLPPSIAHKEDYDPIAFQAKLSPLIRLLFITLDDDKEEKIHFLDIYLQLNQNNPFNDGFFKIFPEFSTDVNAKFEQLKRIVDCSDFGLDDLETSEEKLLNYLQSISSPQETFRMFTVMYAIKGDKKNSRIMLNNSIMAWKKDTNPCQYLHLIRLTEIELLIYTQDFNQLQEIMADYITSFNEFYYENPQYDLLKLKYDNLIGF